MATITDLDEPFEGTPAAQLTTGNTKADSFFGGTAAASYFTSTHYVGSTSAEININGTSRQARFNLTAAPLIHFDIYVDVETPPQVTAGIITWYSGETLLVGGVRMVYVSPTTFQFQLRDASTSKWTSSTLPIGQYRLAVKMQPGSFTGHSLSVYSGTNIDTTPIESSGDQIATTAGATTVSNVRIGVMTNTTAKLRFDGMTADDTAPVVRSAPATVTSLPWKVRVGGAWVTSTAKTRLSNKWDGDVALTPFKDWAQGVWATKQIGKYGSSGTPNEPATKLLSATLTGTNITSTSTVDAFTAALAMTGVAGYSVRVPWTSLDAGGGATDLTFLDTLRALYPTERLSVRWMAGRYTPSAYKGRTWTDGTLFTGTNACTLTIATDLVTKTAHGLVAGDIVTFSSIVTTTGLAANTQHWVISDGLTANAFKVSTSYGGSAVNLATGNGTANYQVYQSGPCPFDSAGVAGNAAFSAAYATMVTDMSAWCRSNDVRLLHVPTYGMLWAEIANNDELQAMTGYSTSAFVDAHNELLDLCAAEAGPDLAFEWPSSGHNVTTVNPGILGHAETAFTLGEFITQQNGFCGPYAFGRPNFDTGFGAQAYGISQTAHLAAGGTTWAASWSQLNTTGALYLENYLESFIENVSGVNPLTATMAAWVPAPELPEGTPWP